MSNDVFFWSFLESVYVAICLSRSIQVGFFVTKSPLTYFCSFRVNISTIIYTQGKNKVVHI